MNFRVDEDARFQCYQLVVVVVAVVLNEVMADLFA